MQYTYKHQEYDVVIVKYNPVKMSSMTVEREEYPRNKYLHGNLSVKSSMIDKPVGLSGDMPLTSRTACASMGCIEGYRGVVINVDANGEIPYSNIVFPEGTTILAQTNYGFLCDPPNSERELAIYSLIAMGLPSDCERTYYGNVQSYGEGTPIRTITPVPINRTNLIVVPTDTIERWESRLSATYLAYDIFRTENDLKPYRDDVVVQKTLINTDILILDSKLYRSFQKIFKNIVWARLIVDESESHPKIVNSKHFTERAEFTWYLTPSPSAWIKNPIVKERFLSRNIKCDAKTFPEYFYVRNDPEFVEKCHGTFVFKKPVIEDITHYQIVKIMGKTATDHCHEQVQLQTRCRLMETSLNMGHIREISSAANSLQQAKEAIVLGTMNGVADIFRKYRKIHSNQEPIVRHMIGDLIKSCNHMLSRVHTTFNSYVEKQHVELGEKIKGIAVIYEQDSIEMMRDYHQRIHGMIEHFVTTAIEIVPDSQTATTTKPKTKKSSAVTTVNPDATNKPIRKIPLYEINNLGKGEITNKDLQKSVKQVFPMYIPVYGSVRATTIVNTTDKLHPANLIVGLHHGLRVQIATSEKTVEQVVLCCDELAATVVASDFYHKSLRIASSTDRMYIDTAVLDASCIFRLAKKTTCMKMVNGNVRACTFDKGTEIKICF
jgi:hypothetical protein